MARVHDYSLEKIFFCKPRIVTHRNQEVKGWRLIKDDLTRTSRHTIITRVFSQRWMHEASVQSFKAE